MHAASAQPISDKRADFGRGPDTELTSLGLTAGIYLPCKKNVLFIPPAAFVQEKHIH